MYTQVIWGITRWTRTWSCPHFRTYFILLFSYELQVLCQDVHGHFKSSCYDRAYKLSSTIHDTLGLVKYLLSIRILFNNMKYPSHNVKWHSGPWTVIVTPQPIRLSTNFMTLIPCFAFTELRVVSICNGCGMPAGNAYPSGHLVPSPFWDLRMLQLMKTSFPELAVSFPNFPPWISLGIFSILLAKRATVSKASTLIYCGERKRSDSVLWQKPLLKQNNPKSYVTT